MKTRQTSVKVTVNLHVEVPDHWDQQQVEEATENTVFDALDDKRVQLRNIPTFREVFDDYAMLVSWYIEHSEEQDDEA
jgi:hypothetical protein